MLVYYLGKKFLLVLKNFDSVNELNMRYEKLFFMLEIIYVLVGNKW